MTQLDYLQDPQNDPNAKSIADYVMPKPQPVKTSPVRATLPIPQTASKAPVQPAGFQQTNYTPPMNVPSVAPSIASAVTPGNATPAPRPSGAGYSPAGYKINPDKGEIAQFLQDRFGGEGSHYTPQGWVKNAPPATPAPVSTPTPTTAPKTEPAKPAPTAEAKPTIAQNVQAAPTNTSVPKPSKPAKAGKPAANPAVQTQPQAQVDVSADPYAAYKARTGIDLSNVSHAPVPSYVQRVNQTQGMDFQNVKPANMDGTAVVPVETQEQFNQRWALINDFYNSPEGQAVIAARQQGDVVEVQRGDKTSYTDLRNGGEKGIQDFIADQAAKDSALAKSPSDSMNNRELNQLDLLKPKLASETDIAQTGITANASRDVASINNADEAIKTQLLQEYMNPKTDPKRREQLAPLFAGKDNKEIVVQGGEMYNEESGQMQKVPSYVYDPSIKDYRYPNGAKPNATSGQSKLLGKPATKGGKPLPEGAIVNDGGVKLQVVNGVLQLAN